MRLSLLATISLILLTGCKTTVKPVIQRLEADITKPVLVNIPEIDTSGMSSIDKANVKRVVTAYNTNVVELINYANQLEILYKETVEYYESVFDISR